MKYLKALLLTLFVAIVTFIGISYYRDGKIDLSTFTSYFDDASSIASTFNEPLSVSEADLDDGYHFYYSTLTPAEKQLYVQLYVICRDRLDYTAVSINDTETINRTMEYMLLDNPQLYYVDSWKTQTTVLGDNAQFSVKAVDSMSAGETELAKTAINGYTNACLSHIRDDMSDYEKALFLYEYIIKNTDYIEDAPHNQDLYSVVMGKSVCKGYTCAFKYFCDRLSIPCISVTGRIDEDHAWNLIQINGEWCHVDCTSGDDISDGSDLIDYSWFGINDKLMLRSHKLNDSDRLPACESIRNDYFYRNNRYFEHMDYKRIYALFQKGAKTSFQFADQTLYDQFKDIIETADFMQKLGYNGVNHISYTMNENTFTYVFDCN